MITFCLWQVFGIVLLNCALMIKLLCIQLYCRWTFSYAVLVLVSVLKCIMTQLTHITQRRSQGVHPQGKN